jgi:hypothetical protein
VISGALSWGAKLPELSADQMSLSIQWFSFISAPPAYLKDVIFSKN